MDAVTARRIRLLAFVVVTLVVVACKKERVPVPAPVPAPAPTPSASADAPTALRALSAAVFDLRRPTDNVESRLVIDNGTDAPVVVTFHPSASVTAEPNKSVVVNVPYGALAFAAKRPDGTLLDEIRTTVTGGDTWV